MKYTFNTAIKVIVSFNSIPAPQQVFKAGFFPETTQTQVHVKLKALCEIYVFLLPAVPIGETFSVDLVTTTNTRCSVSI